MLVLVHELTGLGAPAKVGLDRLEQADGLLVVVERGDDDVPTLPTPLVEPIVRQNEPANAVVISRYECHHHTLCRVLR